MKNLKKLNRGSLKSITGGRPAAASECINCGCPTTVCYYINGNMVSREKIFTSKL